MLAKLFEAHVNRAIDVQAGIAKPYLVLGISTQKFIRLKHRICDKLLEKGPTVGDAYAYVDRALDVETLLWIKLQSLSPEEFEGITRRAYKQDEWKLFDLATDPKETTDLAAKHPDHVRAMARQHARWSATLAPLAEVPNIRTTQPIIPRGHGWARAGMIDSGE